MNKFLIKDKMLFFYIGAIVYCLWSGAGAYEDKDYFWAMIEFLFLGMNVGMLFHYHWAKGYIKNAELNFGLITSQHEALIALDEICREQNKLLTELKDSV